MKSDKSAYRVLLPEWRQPEPYFEFTGKLARTRQGRTPPYRVASDDKQQPVHEMASTCDSLLDIHPNAIVVGTPMGAAGNTIMLIVITLVTLGVTCSEGYVAVLALLEVPILGVAMIIATTLSLLFSLFCLRVTLFSPRDLPVLFNRKDRSVSFIPYKQPSFWRFWEKGGVGDTRTSAWDEVKVRSYRWTQLTGTAARESYFLSLLWSEAGKPRTCAEIVNIGYAGWWEDAMLWRLYEHIRRYMEEDGLPLPLGETLRQSGVGKLPAFPAQIIAAAGGVALTMEQVAQLQYGESVSERATSPSQHHEPSPRRDDPVNWKMIFIPIGLIVFAAVAFCFSVMKVEPRPASHLSNEVEPLRGKSVAPLHQPPDEQDILALAEGDAEDFCHPQDGSVKGCQLQALFTDDQWIVIALPYVVDPEAGPNIGKRYVYSRNGALIREE